MAEGSTGSSSGGSNLRKPIWWVAGLVIVAAAAALFLSWRASHAPPATAHAPAVAPAPAAEPAVQNPVPAAGGAAQPLPPLDASDASVHEALGQLVGKPSADSLFRPEMIVRHMVVTVDNLSRKQAAVELRPTKPVAGAFLAAGNDEHATIDPANYQRYAPYVQVLQMLDPNSSRHCISTTTRCFSRPTRTSAIPTAISMTGWSRPSTICWRRRT